MEGVNHSRRALALVELLARMRRLIGEGGSGGGVGGGGLGGGAEVILGGGAGIISGGKNVTCIVGRSRRCR